MFWPFSVLVLPWLWRGSFRGITSSTSISGLARIDSKAPPPALLPLVPSSQVVKQPGTVVGSISSNAVLGSGSALVRSLRNEVEQVKGELENPPLQLGRSEYLNKVFGVEIRAREKEKDREFELSYEVLDKLRSAVFAEEKSCVDPADSVIANGAVLPLKSTNMTGLEGDQAVDPKKTANPERFA
ncbi:uncharacterized protein G2W53_016375 [Senna tora]|uniref:Uncharacterized protein n=1 Tax=Senna tora TaxID=362788 RepID=A0A834TQQ3_9FABA|nr:uncharacterized protein G2W53_016375 [Senna tora]